MPEKKGKTWHEKHKETSSFGERVADGVANFVGSWNFIIGQASLMALWGIVNTLEFFHVVQFDPYPFVFLNLFMSAEAAFSTPIILMSQNRAADRDRQHAQEDYETNIEAERRIESLQLDLARIENDKLDKIIELSGQMVLALKALVPVQKARKAKR